MGSFSAHSLVYSKLKMFFSVFFLALIPLITGLEGPIEEVCIKTGDGLWDGTNSRVSVCIYGTNVGHDGSCCSNQLNGHGDDFQHGDNDCYAEEHGLGRPTMQYCPHAGQLPACICNFVLTIYPECFNL